MLDLSRPLIISEAGTCHASPNAGERLDKAKRYVLAAHDAGAGCIKFQMFDDTDLFCPYEGDEQRMPRWLDSRLTLDEWRQVKEFTEACGMVFLASVFQHSTVVWLHKLNVEATKIASRAVEKFPYGEAPEPYLISTGMFKAPPLDCEHYVFECEANYPSTAEWRGPDTGFSDHSGNPDRAIDAMKRGCKLIEVHFYIDRIDAGPDLPASLNPYQLRTVCNSRSNK